VTTVFVCFFFLFLKKSVVADVVSGIDPFEWHWQCCHRKTKLNPNQPGVHAGSSFLVFSGTSSVAIVAVGQANGNINVW
jgi:hypothetical protein